MRRRALLSSAAAAAAAGLAGCLDQTGGDDTTEPPASTASTTTATTRTPTTERSTDRFDASLALTLERLQPGVAVLGVDSVGVRSSGSQYLFFHVDVTDGAPPEREDFGFRYGGDVFGPGVDTGGQVWRASETNDRYTVHRGAGWLVFEVPAERNAGHAAFTLGSDEWPVSDATRDRLASGEPSLDVSWGVADDQPDASAALSFAVTNEGDVDTRFVAGLNAVELRSAYRPVAAFHRMVPAGETVSWTVTDDTVGPVQPADDEDAGQYKLDWTQGEDNRYVEAANAE